MDCPRCGAALRLDEGYCPQCGAKYAVQRVRQAGKKCPACGRVVPAEATVCPGCGQRFASDLMRRETVKTQKAPGQRKMKSPLTGLFVALTVILSVLVVGAAGFLIWYFLV